MSCDESVHRSTNDSSDIFLLYAVFKVRLNVDNGCEKQSCFSLLAPLGTQEASLLSFTDIRRISVPASAPKLMRTSTQRFPAQSARLLDSLSPGDGEIRTLDPLLARQVLSQLSYTPN